MGVYLACIGCDVILADFPSMKDLVERNIGINKSHFKGKAEFTVANWYNCPNLGRILTVSESAFRQEKITQQHQLKNKNAYFI